MLCIEWEFMFEFLLFILSPVFSSEKASCALLTEDQERPFNCISVPICSPQKINTR